MLLGEETNLIPGGAICNCTQVLICIQATVMWASSTKMANGLSIEAAERSRSYSRHLRPFRNDITDIAVESTYNWYWLVDLLMAEGYRVHLANPSAIQKYTGLKYSDDRHDAFWLAEMMRLGILPEGYIYPKEDRPIRDLLRKRSHLVRLRTSLIISLQKSLAGTTASSSKSAT